MAHTNADSQSDNKYASRRRSPRIEVLGQIHGQLVAMNLPLVVQNLGIGGFAVKSPIAFPRGAVHEFRFTTAAGPKIVVRAKTAHCRLMDGPEDADHYLAGFEFVRDAEGRTGQAVELLLDAATSVLMFQ